MKTIIIIVRNTTTTETYIYTREELTKARIAVDYLTTTTPYLWYIERKMVEAYASTFLSARGRASGHPARRIRA